MPLTPLADLTAFGLRLGMDLVDAHGDPTKPEGVRALAALEDASALVRTEAGKTYVDSHDLLVLGIPDVITSIVLAVAYRAFRNPEGTTQSSLGDVSVSFAREGSAGAVFLTKAEQRAIRKAAGRNTFSGITMESPYFINATDVNHLAPVEGQSAADPVPMGPWPWEGV